MFLTASFSVRRGGSSEAHARGLLSDVSARAFERWGVKVLLLKHTHCDLSVLRRMHRPFVEALGRVRERVDPTGVLTSRLLHNVGL